MSDRHFRAAPDDFDHPDHEHLVAFVDDQVNEIDRDWIAGHMEICAVCREDADDLMADLVEVDAERLKHARRDALAFADKAKQEVLRPDVVVAEPTGLVDSQLDDALGARGQSDLPDDRAVAPTDDELDRGADLGQFDVHVLEDAGRDAFVSLRR